MSTKTFKGSELHLATLLLKSIDVMKGKEWVGLQDLPCQQQSRRSKPENTVHRMTSTYMACTVSTLRQQQLHGNHLGCQGAAWTWHQMHPAWQVAIILDAFSNAAAACTERLALQAGTRHAAERCL
jgi:hypothetical protein